MNGYLWLKLIHVLSVMLFLGNIITGMFWMRHATKTRDIKIIAHAMRGVIISDRWFTIPGVIIITAAGFAAALHVHLPLLRTGWIFWSIVLFSLSGIIFSFWLAPMQQKIYKMTVAVENKETDENFWQQYMRNYHKWEVLGVVATLTPLLAMVLMVLKIPARTFFLQ